MKTIYLIVWYFPSFHGGGEKSIFEELKKFDKTKFNIKVISFDEEFNSQTFQLKHIKGKNIFLKYLIPQSRMLTYFFNRGRILKTLSKENFSKDDLVITQGLFGPIIANFCIKNNIKYHYYLRDEISLNEFHNYWKSYKKIIKNIKNLIEKKAIKIYSKDNVIALSWANKIISNSKFIQKKLKEKFNLDSYVQFPKLNLTEFENVKLNPKKQKYITFIGGNNELKGFDVVLNIAKKLPDLNFLIVGPYKKIFTKKNITYMPYNKNVVAIYSRTKLLLVPSRWQEAYARVVMEANYLGIPVISSNRGGLVESNTKGTIIENFENIQKWVLKINKITTKRD